MPPQFQEGLRSKLVGQRIFLNCAGSSSITIAAVSEDGKTIFRFASPNQLPSGDVASDFLRFLRLIDDVVFSEEDISFADWIHRLRPLIESVYDNPRPKWNMYSAEQNTPHSPGCIRRTIEWMRCASYTYYLLSWELSGVLEEISSLRATCRAAKCQQLLMYFLSSGWSADSVERIDHVSA